MKRASLPPPGQTGPRRPYLSTYYQSCGCLCDLARIASQPKARIVQWSSTPRLSGNRFADTYSSGVIEFASGYRCPACITLDGRGCLQVELPRNALLNTADAAAAAAIVGAHRLEQARHCNGSN